MNFFWDATTHPLNLIANIVSHVEANYNSIFNFFFTTACPDVALMLISLSWTYLKSKESYEFPGQRTCASCFTTNLICNSRTAPWGLTASMLQAVEWTWSDLEVVCNGKQTVWVIRRRSVKDQTKNGERKKIDSDKWHVYAAHRDRKSEKNL